MVSAVAVAGSSGGAAGGTGVGAELVLGQYQLVLGIMVGFNTYFLSSTPSHQYYVTNTRYSYPILGHSYPILGHALY